MPRFFDNAPAISWSQWVYRRLIGTNVEPTLITARRRKFIGSPTGVPPKQATSACANEYAAFLKEHFSVTYKLDIPPAIFKQFLGNQLKGVEIRDAQSKLVALIFSWYSGLLTLPSNKTVETGIITWHCVHPIWRKKGLPDCLLHAIEIYANRPVHFFRNDGWLKSPLPPLWTDTKIVRKRNKNRSPINLQRFPIQTCISDIEASWKQRNPTGFFLHDTAVKSLVEVWGNSSARVYIQPTFEVTGGLHSCEVLCWTTQKNEYETSIHIEAILDALLPYDIFEAPFEMPHMDSIWDVGGQSSWSLYGLDPGNPVVRPVISMVIS